MIIQHIKKSLRCQVTEHSDTMKVWYCTVVLVRSFQVVSISQQSPDSLSQTIFVGLLGSLIQQNVGDQTRVSAVLHILRQQRGQKNKKETSSDSIEMKC